MPLLALIRQEWLAWHRRRFALAAGAHATLMRGSSKTAQAIRRDGLPTGLQAMHMRWLLGQARVQERAIDPLLPYAPAVPVKDVVKECKGMDMTEDAAQQLARQLTDDGCIAASACARARADLSGEGAAMEAVERELAAVPSPAQGAISQVHCDASVDDDVVAGRRGSAVDGVGALSALPCTRVVLRAPDAHGTLYLLNDTQPAAAAAAAAAERELGGSAKGTLTDSSSGAPVQRYLFVYQPRSVAALRWLKCVRDLDPLPPTPDYRGESFALYDFLRHEWVRDSLARAGVSATLPFTAVLPMNEAHVEKLLVMYRHTAAVRAAGSAADAATAAVRSGMLQGDALLR
ncbi:hypothetical protein EON68_04160, partial [archaeon]